MIPLLLSERRATLALGLLAGLAAASADAQYFGGNKVRYEDPEFRVIKSEHFDIYTYPEEDPGAKEAAVLMERWNGRFNELLEHKLTGRQPLILYAGHPAFRQTNATPGEIGEGTGGFTEMFKRRIVLPLTGSGAETDHVLGHELVHAFQFDIAKKEATDQKGSAANSSAMRLPLWFIEGMAEYLSLGSVDTHTSMWLRDSILHDDLPTIEKLNKPKYFPYRFGHAFWAYVGGKYGDAMVQRLFRTAAKVGDVGRAIKLELKVDHKQLSKEWHEALKAEFTPQLEASRPLKDLGRALIPARKTRALNISPALSPDGKKMLFFSERSQYSIELYVLDVETGEVVTTLTKSATDPHLDSLQFLYTSGTWSPDGKRVAMGGVGDGRPVLRIVDAQTGDQLEEHRFTDLVEVLHPAWSPDGKTIAFAANKGGLLQLQLFDLDSKKIRPLTHEPYAGMQPAWSPDSKSIVFVTDRFTSDAKQLTYGEYRLAWLNVSSGAVTPVPGLLRGKNINPQWSADGAYIYFLSDGRGTTDLYRVSTVNGVIEQMTQVKTGISGLARQSPALSVAGSRIAASVFDEGRYSVYLIEADKGTVVAAVDPSAPKGALPPRSRFEPKVDSLLSQAAPAKQDVAVEGPQEYKPRLGIDYAAQPNITVGTSSVGSFAGGGVALYWSDMLGDHNLLTVLQAEGDSETIGRNLVAVASYENRASRWIWGGAAGQIPNVNVFYEQPVFTAHPGTGEPAIKESLVRQWQINREISSRAAYPFTRADRFETSVGYRHVSYVYDAVYQWTSQLDGRIIEAGVEERPAPESLQLYPVGAAFVHDTSVFGGTGPIAGQRYRVEAGMIGGDLEFWSPLIDFRQYYNPFQYLSFAGRLLHFGRYGTDGESDRLGAIYLGSWGLVRGYGYSSFSIFECPPPPATDCPVFDQLLGSRIAMGSVEARVPVFGARGLVPSPAVPPIDFALFYDAGVAWTSQDEARFLGGDRDLVRSRGVSMRVNFFGVLVLQWSYVDPLDRPTQDWYWEFMISPGF